MQLGVTVRNMGPESTPSTLLACVQTAQAMNFDSVWITDHIAIPPDDAQGSGGRYLDTLTTLAWLAGVTQTIQLGAGVLILPYRAALPTAKQIATVQELSGHRLILGVGVGWMAAEFKALGVERRSRGVVTDATLEFINRCFSDDIVVANEQPFLFKPRPPKPPILVGGGPQYGIARAAAWGDGWLPMANSPEKIAPAITQYRALTERLGKPAGQVTVMARLPLHEPTHAAQTLARFEQLGVDRVVCAIRYSSPEEYEEELKLISQLIEI